jgi:hypothetical protein
MRTTDRIEVFFYAVLLAAACILFAALRPVHAQQWQLPNYGRDHGVVGGPGMPKCNPQVSEECRRLYGGQVRQRAVARSPAHDVRLNCARQYFLTQAAAGDPRAARMVAKHRAGADVASVVRNTADGRAMTASADRYCRARGQ